MTTVVPVRGVFEVNCYFFVDEQTGHGFVIDPGAEAGRLLDLIRRKDWIIEKILLTHGHFDHTGAVNEIRDALGIPVFAHENSAHYLLDARMNLSEECGSPILIHDAFPLKDGDTICLSENPAFSLSVLFTPGHTTDSISLYSEKENTLFVGDTIFKGTIGTYQYPGGNYNDLRESIVKKLFMLPDKTLLLSGHSEKTSIGQEKRRYGL